MNRLVMIICFFAATTVSAQTAEQDSLSNLLSSSQNQERVKLLHQLVKSSWRSNPDIAKKYGQEAIRLSNELVDSKLLSTSYRLLGGVYNYIGEIDSGMFYKEKALEIALELNDPALLAPTYNNLGVTAQTIGNFVEALEYFYKAYHIGNSLSEWDDLPIIMANISEVYYDMNIYDSAIVFAQMAVSITEEKSKPSRKMFSKIVLGRAKLAKGDFSEAKEIFDSVVDDGEKIDEKRYTAYGYQGLSRLSIVTGDVPTARALLNKALHLFIALDDETYIAETYIDLAQMYLTIDPDSSLFFTRKSLEMTQKLELNDLILLNYENLIDLFKPIEILTVSFIITCATRS